jgi:hypothetical protein
MKYPKNTRKNSGGYKHPYPQVWTRQIIIIFQYIMTLFGATLSAFYSSLLCIFQGSLISVLSMHLAKYVGIINLASMARQDYTRTRIFSQGIFVRFCVPDKMSETNSRLLVCLSLKTLGRFENRMPLCCAFEF